MTKKEQQDEISLLLDSFYEDNTLEQKMDDFSRTKNQKKGHEEEIKENISSNIVQEVKLTASDLGDTKSSDTIKQSVGKTRTFDAKELENTSNGTVVIDDKKIKSIISKENGIQLKRKILSKEDTVSETKVGGVVLDRVVKNETTSDGREYRRTIAVIVAAVLGLILVGLVVFGITRVISNFTDADESSEVQQEYYNEICEWAQDYNSYSDEEKEKIVDLEKKYNKLTSEQKESINEILKNQTGSTFDELLAIAKSSKKEDSTNNNTEIAQKKAELKEQIDDLKTQLSTAQNTLNEANQNLESIQKEVNSAKQEVDSIQKELNQYDLDSLVTQLNDLAYDLQYLDLTSEEIEKLQSQYNAVEQEIMSANDVQVRLDYAQQQLDDATYRYNQASEEVTNAQTVVDELNSSISSLQSEYDSLK